MRGKWLFVGMAALSFSGSAVAKESQGSLPLDIEFLEFLGGWETNDGVWIDPLSLASDSDAARESEIMEGSRLTGDEGDNAPFSKEGTSSTGEKDEDD
ncbi:MAG: hypothetical protein ACE5FZ_08005 [Nitrospiria bacterium]